MPAGPGAGPAARLGAVRPSSLRSALVLVVTFDILLVLVCVATLAFAGLVVKKLYQGQR
ncbi:hypothetical protein GCM10010400_44410 [Streptomyces aculeolatus]